MIEFRQFTEVDWYGYAGAEGDAHIAHAAVDEATSWDLVLDDSGLGVYLMTEVGSDETERVVSYGWHVEAASFKLKVKLANTIAWGDRASTAPLLAEWGFEEVDC